MTSSIPESTYIFINRRFCVFGHLLLVLSAETCLSDLETEICDCGNVAKIFSKKTYTKVIDISVRNEEMEENFGNFTIYFGNFFAITTTTYNGL